MVIGAGLSAADYPLWPGLIEILQERCGLRAENIVGTDPLDVAQAAKDKKPLEYARALDQTFKRKNSQPRVDRRQSRKAPWLGISDDLRQEHDPILHTLLHRVQL